MIKYLVLVLIAAAIALMGTFTAIRSEKGNSSTAYATKDTTIRDVLALDEGISDMLAELGMYCSGCPSAVSETVEEACTVHNLDTDEILHAINDYMREKNSDN